MLDRQPLIVAVTPAYNRKTSAPPDVQMPFVSVQFPSTASAVAPWSRDRRPPPRRATERGDFWRVATI
jgi:hypothetical protein